MWDMARFLLHSILSLRHSHDLKADGHSGGSRGGFSSSISSYKDQEGDDVKEFCLRP